MKKFSAILFFVSCIGTFFSFPASTAEIQTSPYSVIARFRQVSDKIFAGARPREEGVRQLARMGIKTIVNLEREWFEEEPGEVRKEKNLAEKLGIRFFRVPMHSLFPPKKEQVDKAVALISNAENQPVFVHCDLGKDRTGIVIAAYRVKVEAWLPEKAYEEMEKNGFSRLFLGVFLGWKTFFFEYARGVPN